MNKNNQDVSLDASDGFQVKFTFMNFKTIISWLCLLLTSATSMSQVDIEFLKFRTANGDSYIDIVLDIPGEHCRYEYDQEDLFWQSITTITVIAESGGKITQYKKTELLSPEITDSTEAHSTSQLHLERLPLVTGRYKVTIEIDAKNKHKFVENIEIILPGAPEISSTLLVEAYAPADENWGSKFFRSGFDMIPIAGKEISPVADKLRLYAELYNIHEVVTIEICCKNPFIF